MKLGPARPILLLRGVVGDQLARRVGRGRTASGDLSYLGFFSPPGGPQHAGACRRRAPSRASTRTTPSQRNCPYCRETGRRSLRTRARPSPRASSARCRRGPTVRFPTRLTRPHAGAPGAGTRRTSCRSCPKKHFPPARRSRRCPRAYRAGRRDRDLLPVLEDETGAHPRNGERSDHVRRPCARASRRRLRRKHERDGADNCPCLQCSHVGPFVSSYPPRQCGATSARGMSAARHRGKSPDRVCRSGVRHDGKSPSRSDGTRPCNPRSRNVGGAPARPERYQTEGSPRLQHFTEIAASHAERDTLVSSVDSSPSAVTRA